MPQYQVKILKTTQETPNVKTIQFERPKEFNFVAGQFLMAATGYKDEKGLLVKRAYSIASSPQEKEFIELCIAKKQPPSFSAALHEMKPNDSLFIEGPFGKFVFKEPLKENTILIAAGTGIAPIRSILNTITSKPLAHKIKLFFSFHFPKDYVYRAEFEKLAAKEKNFEIIATMSAREKELPEWRGNRGRVTAHLPAHIKKGTEYSAYICGPPQMVSDTVKQLIDLGVKETNIHKEMW